MFNLYFDYWDFCGDIRIVKENNVYVYYVSVSGYDDVGEICIMNVDECLVIFRGMVDDIFMKNLEVLLFFIEMKVFVGQYVFGNGKFVKIEYVLVVGDNDVYIYFVVLFGDENFFNIIVDVSCGFVGKFIEKAASLACQLFLEQGELFFFICCYMFFGNVY